MLAGVYFFTDGFGGEIEILLFFFRFSAWPFSKRLIFWGNVWQQKLVGVSLDYHRNRIYTSWLGSGGLRASDKWKDEENL